MTDSIADAIGEYIVDNTDMGIMPMVGGFTLMAEIIDPATGKPNLVTIQDTSMPMWTEWGMLMARLSELTMQWQQAEEAEYEGWEDN